MAKNTCTAHERWDQDRKQNPDPFAWQFSSSCMTLCVKYVRVVSFLWHICIFSGNLQPKKLKIYSHLILSIKPVQNVSIDPCSDHFWNRVDFFRNRRTDALFFMVFLGVQTPQSQVFGGQRIAAIFVQRLSSAITRCQWVFRTMGQPFAKFEITSSKWRFIRRVNCTFFIPKTWVLIFNLPRFYRQFDQINREEQQIQQNAALRKRTGPSKAANAVRPPRDNWYRDDWFSRQDQWQHDTHRDSYQYRREADDRYITRLRSPSPERAHWMQDRSATIGYYSHLDTKPPPIGSLYQNRSLDRKFIPSLYEYSSAVPPLAPRAMAASGLGGQGGRRLPQPPPEAQKALAMPLPNTPLPMSQKPVALSFRNRKLPRLPTSQPTNVGIGVPVQSRMAQQKPQAAVRGSRSFNMPFGSLFGGGGGQANGNLRQQGVPPVGRSGRGAKLPVVPGTVPANTGLFPSLFANRSAANRRQLPERSGPHSRSLENDYYDPNRVRSTLETVVEAGRGVRKLPAQPVSANPTPMGRSRFQTGTSAVLAMSRMQNAVSSAAGVIQPNDASRPSALHGIGNGYPAMTDHQPNSSTVQFTQPEWT